MIRDYPLALLTALLLGGEAWLWRVGDWVGRRGKRVSRGCGFPGCEKPIHEFSPKYCETHHHDWRWVSCSANGCARPAPPPGFAYCGLHGGLDFASLTPTAPEGRCSTCGRGRDENPVCSNAFHVAHLLCEAEGSHHQCEADDGDCTRDALPGGRYCGGTHNAAGLGCFVRGCSRRVPSTAGLQLCPLHRRQFADSRHLSFTQWLAQATPIYPPPRPPVLPPGLEHGLTQHGAAVSAGVGAGALGEALERAGTALPFLDVTTTLGRSPRGWPEVRSAGLTAERITRFGVESSFTGSSESLSQQIALLEEIAGTEPERPRCATPDCDEYATSGDYCRDCDIERVSASPAEERHPCGLPGMRCPSSEIYTGGDGYCDCHRPLAAPARLKLGASVVQNCAYWGPLPNGCSGGCRAFRERGGVFCLAHKEEGWLALDEEARAALAEPRWVAGEVAPRCVNARCDNPRRPGGALCVGCVGEEEATTQ